MGHAAIVAPPPSFQQRSQAICHSVHTGDDAVVAHVSIAIAAGQDLERAVSFASSTSMYSSDGSCSGISNLCFHRLHARFGGTNHGAVHGAGICWREVDGMRGCGQFGDQPCAACMMG
jgi:hypothetical protein